ncbi:MAG: NADH-quinone oxidoreductase subunit C/D [Puniceicoccaceae bacterium]|nr:MAG: NADH-quinone oxidoreductase subunit C/D [Puniceicoccaceae bacterium]
MPPSPTTPASRTQPPSGPDTETPPAVAGLRERFGAASVTEQRTRDGLPTCWVPPDSVPEVLRFLKHQARPRFPMLYDLTAVDERSRSDRHRIPAADFTVVYHLLSLEPFAEIRIKTALQGETPSLPSVTRLWPTADWYECEVWDMFGIRFEGHPHLRRLHLPRTWQGHPLRKEHPARATEMGPFQLTEARHIREEEALRFDPGEWGLERQSDESDFMFLNIGPQHPGTHGVIRFILQLDGEEIIDAIPEIGFHHRGAEKMGERQSWHTYIPYTDRVDYLGGTMNNLPYLLAVENLAGIEVPDRAKVIRILLCELFRISNHLVWYGTYAQDVGQMSPVFYTFNDRERLLGIIEAICGARMHPNWFRIGGVAADLPRGWDGLVRDFLEYFPSRLHEYDAMIMGNSILKARTVGIGEFNTEEAIDWGVTGPALRATGLAWDLRKARPYAGYDQFEFDIPTASRGDCYGRGLVRIEEMRQSLRIIRQCLDNMPEGPVRADHPLAVPPPKEQMLHDIETLITHFLGVSWGPVIPAGEAVGTVEGTKGLYSYYLTSDKSTLPYRVRIRSGSFPHMRIISDISRGHTVADLLAIIGATDFVLADVDR